MRCNRLRGFCGLLVASIGLACAAARPAESIATPATASMPDSLSQSDIMNGVLEHRTQIVRCITEQKARAPEVGGRLVMRWTILTSGLTRDVAPVDLDPSHAHLASCLRESIEAWKFPRHRTQGDPIDFPFTF